MAGVDPEPTAGQMIVEVAYARPDRQVILETPVPFGTTAMEAVGISGIVDRFAEIDAACLDLGIFGVAVDGDRLLEPGDRVEIYRALKVDPREARRRRVMEATGATRSRR